MESTCTGAVDYGSIIYYSHLVPLSIIILITFFVSIKTKFSLLSNAFLMFNLFFALWLVGDIVTWVSKDYDTISFFWASLDYINILAYLSALYFFLVLLRGKDLDVKYKIILFATSLPAWFVTVSNQSIIFFNVTGCEALNNDFLTNYKILIELSVIVFIAISTLRNYIKYQSKKNILVSVAMILFLSIFSITEFISSETGVYEINLYSLFVLPVFLFVIIFSITNLKVFNVRIVGTQLLAYTMIILAGSQFFFLENYTNKVLTVITFILSLSFGVLLVKDAKREILQREHIEKLAADLTRSNTRLLELDKQKSEFVSFATHQLRAPLTAMRGYTSLILEGDMGPVNPEVKEAVGRVSDSSRTLVNIVDDYLNISRVELGTIKYTFDLLDIAEMTRNVVDELKPNIEKKGLKFEFTTNPATQDARFMVHADKDKLKQVVSNLIDNSVKYTPSGSLSVLINKNTSDRKILLSIKDTGVGISPAVMPKLFEKFVRADNANKQNIFGTGLGLYIAKQIVMAHKGRVWAESEGEGKGSTFFLELDMEV